MIRTVFAGVSALIPLAACDKAAESPAAATEPAEYVRTVDLAPAAAPATFSDAVGQFNPATQHFVWVLPEGVHGKAPWEMNVTVKHRGEVEFQTSIPLKAEIAAAGSRPEFPAGSEAVRLSDDGSWAKHMTEVEKVINGLIAQFGRGDGELLMESELKTTIDDAHRNAYCVEHKQPVVNFYIEEGDQLTRFELGPLAPVFQATILKSCNT